MYAYNGNTAYKNRNGKSRREVSDRNDDRIEIPKTSNEGRVAHWREGVDPDHPVIRALELIATIDLMNNLTIPLKIPQE